jgi:hypothetical protein
MNSVSVKHGSNNQLFLTLRKQITIIQKTDKKIHDMSSAINEIDMEFKEIKNVNIETIGSFFDEFGQCLTSIDFYLFMLCFHWFIFNRTRSGNLWQWSDCFNVDILNFFNSDDKVYIYKDYKTYEDEISLTSLPWCITVVPCTDKAVVTLPQENSCN